MTDEIAVPDGRTHAENAQLALLLEVSGTPKPGNVDRHRDLDDLSFAHFLAGAVGSGPGLRCASGESADDAGSAPDSDPVPIGAAFETAVAGMSRQSAGNTQFGCLLLLVPLARAASTGRLTPDGVREVCESTTVADAEAFYRAFEYVDVAVDEPPAGAAELDVRRGSEVIPTLREREITLFDVMERSATRDGVPDGNAVEWTTGFDRTFEGASELRSDDGPVLDRVARLFCRMLAETPDTLVATQHGTDVARDVMDRAAALGDDLDAAEELATEFVSSGINPGTTADRTCASVYVALERGLTV